MTSRETGPMKVVMRASSGPTREACAFTVTRWDARVGPGHESAEVRLLANEGGRTYLIHGTQGPLAGVWRADSGEVHFAIPGELHRMRWNGASWDRDVQPVPGVFPDLWGAWDDLAFGWGVAGMIRWNGVSWASIASPGDVYAVHGATRDLIFAAGRKGLFARWDGGAWRVMEPPCTDDLIAIHAAADDDVWAVTKSGALLHGTTLGLRPALEAKRPLRAVARFLGKVYVAIESEGLFTFDDGALTLVKDTFLPHQLDARRELLVTAREHIVGTADGATFKATTMKTTAGLLEPHRPLWL